jgi:ketosteroid isomerase-like protein
MMAQDNRSDLARLERMERRLQALEDAEAIRNLKARYAALCDDQYDADGIAALFTEDALWESPALGRFEGREAIRGFFRGASANGLAGFHGPTSSGSAAFAAHRLNLVDMAESL